MPGKAVAAFARANLPSLSGDFLRSCDHCDRLREELLTSNGLSQDRVGLFARYVKVLTTICAGVDLRQANVSFTWKGLNMNDLNFEIVCLGYNIVGGIVATTARQDLWVSETRDAANKCITAARAIQLKIASLHRDAFRSVVTKPSIEILEKYLNALFSYIVLSRAIQQSSKNKLLAGIAMTAVSHFRAVFTDRLHSNFLEVFSYFTMARHFVHDSNDPHITNPYGIAISYGAKIGGVVKQNDAKMNSSGIAGEWKILTKAVTAYMTDLKQKNSAIWMQGVPPVESLPEVSIIPALLPNGDSYDWDEVGEELSMPEAASSELDRQRHQFAALQETATSLASELDNILALYPDDTVNETHTLTAQLESQRRMTTDLVQEISRLLNVNGSQANKNELQLLSRSLGASQANDDRYQLNLGIALSLIEPMNKVRRAVRVLQPQVAEISAIIESIIGRGEDIDTEDADKVLRECNWIETKSREFAAKLETHRASIAEHAAQMKSDAEKCVPPFRAEVIGVVDGMKAGIRNYESLNGRLQQLRNKVHGG